MCSTPTTSRNCCPAWPRPSPGSRRAICQPDGTITVFSNSNDRFHSQIIAVDPKTGLSRDLFAGTGLGFDSFIMGKHQHLPNGNWLITPTIQGRAIEATPEGRIVREYNNILNGDYNALVLYAEHLEPDYLAKVPTCAH